MRHYVEKDWNHKGLRCVVVVTEMGHRCGYVGIDPSHILFGKSYSSPVPKELSWYFDKVKEGTVGKRNIIDIICYDSEAPRIGILFDVHGGVTFSEGGKYPVESDLWWFGYDCAHSGDSPDRNLISGEYRESRLKYMNNYGEVRTLEYCISECESLADQLIEVGKR